MARYRRRYLTSDEFSSYCSDLNLGLLPFDRELELYDREGVLLPVARVVLRDEYLIKRAELDQNPQTYGVRITGWDELERVLLPRRSLQILTDSDLWHPFDREFEQGNKYIFCPNKDQFKEWKSYRVNLQPDTDNGLFKKSVKHYYHYYQVHRVYAIQKHYPVFAKHNWLLKDDVAKDRIEYLVPLEGSNIISMNGHISHFDALSFYIELYKSEEKRTFEHIPEVDGVKTLNTRQFTHYENQLKKHAKYVVQRFAITDEDLYEFMFYLFNLRSKYKHNEHLKLASELTIDLQYLTRLIAGANDLSFSDIENEIIRRTGSDWTRQDFRHLDKALQVYDYTRGTFERLRDGYNTSFSNFQISLNEIDYLMSFIEDQGLFIIPYAIFDINETLNDSRPFHATSLYMGLSNLTTGFECCLREIANLANRSEGTNIIITTLHPLIKTMFSWGNVFEQEHSRIKNLYQNDPFSYLMEAYTSPNLDETIKTFLIAYCSRNFVAHNYTLEHDLYSIWYGVIYTAICHALFYSWVYACNNAWV